MKLKNVFFDYFDKKKFISFLRIIVLFVFLILAINLLNTTYSRYESGVISSAKAKIAFFLAKAGTTTKTITFTGLEPDDTDNIYDFYVANYDGSKHANVNLTYTLSFMTTTNIPLEIDVFDKETNESLITNVSVITKDGIYYKLYETNKEYRLDFDNLSYYDYYVTVKFPSIYNNMDKEYQSAIDLFSVIVNAKQVV